MKLIEKIFYAKFNRISDTALDVIDLKPLPKEHRLWKIESAIITPHYAGGSGKTGIREATERIFLANVSKFLNGEQLINEIDRENFLCKI